MGNQAASPVGGGGWSGNAGSGQDLTRIIDQFLKNLDILLIILLIIARIEKPSVFLTG
jgi:hypothetical protein